MWTWPPPRGWGCRVGTMGARGGRSVPRASEQRSVLVARSGGTGSKRMASWRDGPAGSTATARQLPRRRRPRRPRCAWSCGSQARPGGGQGSAPTSSAASSWPGSPCTCHMHSRRMQCTTAHTRRLSPRSGCGPACCCARRGSCAGTACAAPRARPPPPAATPRHRPSARLTAPRSAASAGCRAWATQGSPPPARRGPPGPGGWTARLPPLRIRRSTPLLPSPRCCRRISRLPSPGGAPAAAPRRRCGTGA